MLFTSSLVKVGVYRSELSMYVTGNQLFQLIFEPKRTNLRKEITRELLISIQKLFRKLQQCDLLKTAT